MPTEAQLIDALRRADAAGDIPAATRFAELIKQGRAKKPPRAAPIESDIPELPTQLELDKELYDPSRGLGGLQSIAIGAGKGLTDIARGTGLADTRVGEALGFTPKTEAETAGFAALEKRRPITAGAGEIVGQALPFVPLSIGAAAAAPAAGLGAAGTQALNIGAQGALGALEGGTIAKGQDKDVMGAATAGGLVSAGIEAVSPVLGRGISAVYRKLKGVEPTSASGVAAAFKESLDNKQSASAISEAAPSIENLKDTSRAVYKEIDDMGASLRPDAYASLVQKISMNAQKSGLDKDITPKAMKVIERLENNIGKPITLTELDTMRKVAQNAAGSMEKTDAAIGSQIVEGIDDYLENIPHSAFETGTVSPQEVSKKYEMARDLWGRARRSEVIQEAFDKARLQASGFENGIRVQFRQILNNKKLAKRFKPEEREAMRRVVQGGKGENLARLIGRFAPSEGSAHNVLTGMAGVAGGAAVGGPVGAVLVPGIGYVSRGMAQKMTAKNAEFADQLIRAGVDSRKIAKAYFKNTLPKDRSPEELAELLMSKDIDFNVLPKHPIAQQAKIIAFKRREDLLKSSGATLGAASGAAMAQPQEQ